MQGSPPAALGSGAYVAGVLSALAVLAGWPDSAVAALVVGGLCLGIVAGGLVVTRTSLLGHGASGRVTGAPLVALGAWVTWTGVQSGAGTQYQFTIGSVFLAVVGWGVMVRGGRTTGTGDRGETIATLPRTTVDGGIGGGRRRQLKRLVDLGVIVVVAGVFARAVVRSDPASWLFGGLFLVVFLPGTVSQVRLTDAGLVTTHYVFWVVPFDRSQTAWADIYGYEATDDRLRIGTNYGADIAYDANRIDEFDRVVGVLDDHLPRL